MKVQQSKEAPKKIRFEWEGNELQYEILDRIECDSQVRYRVRDVSSEYGILDQNRDNGHQSVLLRLLSTERVRVDVLLRSLATWQKIASGCLWPISAFGVVGEGPHAGRVAIVGRLYRHSLDAHLKEKDPDRGEISGIFVDVSQALFELHSVGIAHSSLTSSKIVWDPVVKRWQVLPSSMTGSDAAGKDIWDLGQLAAEMLGMKPPHSSDVSTWLRARTSDLGPWRQILEGCLNSNLSARWTAGRALYGVEPVPIANPLTIERNRQAIHVLWNNIPNYKTYLAEVPSGALRSIGTIEPLPYNGSMPGLLGDGHSGVRIADPQHGQVLQTITIDGDLAVYGGAVRLSEIPDVTDLKVIVRRGMLRATWRWPVGVDTAKIALSRCEFVMHPDDESKTHSVGRATFSKSPWFECPIDVTDDRPLCVCVFAARSNHGEPQYASGAGPGSRTCVPRMPRELRYRCVRSRSGFELELTCDRELELPALVLSASKPYAPNSWSTSNVICEVPSGQILRPDGSYRQPLSSPVDKKGHDWIAKLFARNDGDYQWLDILPVDPDSVILK